MTHQAIIVAAGSAGCVNRVLLRVADASATPVRSNGSTNVPTIMIADRAGDIILGTGEYSK